jgi:hypothetical protein
MHPIDQVFAFSAIHFDFISACRHRCIFAFERLINGFRFDHFAKGGHLPMGRVAMIQDPQGATLGLHQPPG